MKSARRRARELALQALYAWQLCGTPAEALSAQLAESEGFDRADVGYFQRLLRGTIGEAGELEKLIAPALDREPAELSPVERAVLLLGAYELKHSPEVPCRVILNEAVELAKRFGGAGGHRYVNGVLDKVARKLRAAEIPP